MIYFFFAFSCFRGQKSFFYELSCFSKFSAYESVNDLFEYYIFVRNCKRFPLFSHKSKIANQMILHIDMDAFYASVEKLDDPRLKHKCVIVGGTSNRGVVSAASYEARRFGVHSAMPIYQAKQKCPHGVFVPPRMSRYKEVSKKVMALLKEFSPLVEPVSIDEAFVDITGSQRLFGEPQDIAREIKRRIHERVHLTCSIGVAPNKFLAKIASDLKKPDGLTLIMPEEVPQFIESLPIKKVPGVGKKTMRQLEALGIRTLGDVHRLPEKALSKHLGKFGQRLRALSAGSDATPVTPHTPHKSISSERTLAADTRDVKLLKRYLLSQSAEVARQLRQAGVRARTIVIKIKDADFKTATRRTTIMIPTQSSKTIYRHAAQLIDDFIITKKIRLIGVGTTGFSAVTASVQMGLFDQKERPGDNWEKVDKALDSISRKFGKDVIGRAALKDSYE
ncbi:MAG: DNA polymerase IV [Desulfobacterales bacterium]|jgi:DNA polymerase-4